MAMVSRRATLSLSAKPTGNKQTDRKRKSGAKTAPATSKRRSAHSDRSRPNSQNSGDTCIFTAESLALKLDSIAPLMVKNEHINCPDLEDFDIDHVESVDDFKHLRKQLNRKVKHFKEVGWDVNYDSAAVAGAKLVIDEKPATRSMTKKLAAEAGCSEQNLLYVPLPSGCESRAARSIANQRKESIVESFVDFQKQMKFKKTVLEHVAKKTEETGCVTRYRRSAAPVVASGMVTPEKSKLRPMPYTDVKLTPAKKKIGPNPLSFSQIMDNYADLLASEIKDRSINYRSFSPIPLNFDESDDEDAENQAVSMET